METVSFDGVIIEIPDISVDYFGEENYYAKAFFLSHIHSDHTQGIFDTNFANHLKETNKYIYMSELTKLLLKSKLKSSNYDILPYIKPLSLKYPTLINENDMNISVSLFPSGHCAGAVMFLFETNSKRILYTGDIRIENNVLTKYRRLHTDYDETIVKQIDNLYLDTTFFSPDYEWFPKRIESTHEICDIIQEWLLKNSNNFVFIKIPAICGSEQLFIEIYKNLKEKVFIDGFTYEEVYSQIPEMENVYTFDENTSRIHASQKFNRHCCERCRINKKLQIFPSALFWTKGKFIDTNKQIRTTVDKDNLKMRVCYSSHSSYTEIMEMLNYLKPKKIFACVNKNDDFISIFVNNYNKSSNKTVYYEKEDSIEDTDPLIIESFNENVDKYSDSSNDSLLLCTPPKKCTKLS